MATGDDYSARQAASVYELCLKLGHHLDDVRDRAAKALITKTSTGLANYTTVSRVVEFPQLALHWLNDRHTTADTGLVKGFIKFYTAVVATCIAENAHIKERFISSGAVQFFEDFRGFEARYAEEIDGALSCLLSQVGPSSSIVQRPPKAIERQPPGQAAEEAKARPSWAELVTVSSADERRLFDASCRIKYSSVGRSKRVSALREVRYVMVFDFPPEVFVSREGILVVEALVSALSDNIEDYSSEDSTCDLAAESLNVILSGLHKKLQLNTKLSPKPCCRLVHVALYGVINAFIKAPNDDLLPALLRTAEAALRFLQHGTEGEFKRHFIDFGLDREEVIKYLDLVTDALVKFFAPSDHYDASPALRLVRTWPPGRLAAFDLCSAILMLSKDVLVQRKRNDRLIEHIISWSLDPQLWSERPARVEALAASVLQSLSVGGYQDYLALHHPDEHKCDLSDRAKAARELKAMGVDVEEYHWSGDSYAAVELRYMVTDVPEVHRIAYERKLDVLLSSRPPLDISSMSAKTREVVHGQYGKTLRHAFNVGGPKLREKVVEALQVIICSIGSCRQLSVSPEAFVVEVITLACDAVKQRTFRPSLWWPFTLLLIQTDGIGPLALHAIRLLCTFLVQLGHSVISKDTIQLGVLPYIVQPMAACCAGHHFTINASLWLLGSCPVDPEGVRDAVTPLTHNGKAVITRQLAWRVLAVHYSDELDKRVVEVAFDGSEEPEIRLECLAIIAAKMTPEMASEVVPKLPSLITDERNLRIPSGAMREAAVGVMGAIEDEESLQSLARDLTKKNLWSAVIDSGSASGIWSLVARCMELDNELLAYLSLQTTLFDPSRPMPLCGPMLEVLRSVRDQLNSRRSAEALRPAVLWMKCQEESMVEWIRRWVAPCTNGPATQLLPWKATLTLASISCIGDSIKLFHDSARDNGEDGMKEMRETLFEKASAELLGCFRPEDVSAGTCDVAVALQSILSISNIKASRSDSWLQFYAFAAYRTLRRLRSDPAAVSGILVRVARSLSESVTGLQLGTPRTVQTPRPQSLDTYRFVATLTRLMGRMAALHPVLCLEGEVSPFVRAFKLVWSAATAPRRGQRELGSDELTAVLLDILITIIIDNKSLPSVTDHLARTGILSLILSLATRPDIPVALLSRCCDIIALAKSSMVNRSTLGKVVDAIVESNVNSKVILQSPASENATAAVTRATVVFELITDLAQCQQTSAKVGPRLVDDGWLDMLKPVPAARHAITPTLQASICRMVLALCLSPCPITRRKIAIVDSAVEVLWRRAIEKRDADAFITMAVLSFHTLKLTSWLLSNLRFCMDF
ncbi:hypothetical protein FOL47_007047 [Perkinsus chesapeaki]|uniref:Uncharacterized protein n=1 Tax=Perkinsus chesapeaki TaxID=330153 RepID=A0A7J6LN47_PERCH|nr:hypothetical protein FOL47_007047 [Perkinsus chesapeaki]